MNQKQEIILLYVRDKKSQRQISKKTGVCRETIKKYIDEYEQELRKVNTELSELDKINIIDNITSKPKYKSCSRQKKAITDDVIKRISEFLKDNEKKRLTGLSKQQKKKIDIYESLVDEGFNLSYGSVVNAINSIERKKREAFIRQEYIPGDIVEFDFGAVKLQIGDDKVREFYLAVFTTAYGNYRWARIYPKQNISCF